MHTAFCQWAYHIESPRLKKRTRVRPVAPRTRNRVLPASRDRPSFPEARKGSPSCRGVQSALSLGGKPTAADRRYSHVRGNCGRAWRYCWRTPRRLCAAAGHAAKLSTPADRVGTPRYTARLRSQERTRHKGNGACPPSNPERQPSGEQSHSDRDHHGRGRDGSSAVLRSSSWTRTSTSGRPGALRRRHSVRRGPTRCRPRPTDNQIKRDTRRSPLTVFCRLSFLCLRDPLCPPLTNFLNFSGGRGHSSHLAPHW